MLGENVLKVASGTKTQTRRVITPQPVLTDLGDFYWKSTQVSLLSERCYYGRIGDRLYVKEKLERRCHSNGVPDWTVYSADITGVPYATGAKEGYCGHAVWEWGKKRVVSPRFMPQWAARHFLEITDIRTQRLQSITETDAEREGVAPLHGSHREAFRQLWDKINDARGFGWEQNPWVWAITFQKLERL
jgi:hypothetical protein